MTKQKINSNQNDITENKYSPEFAYFYDKQWSFWGGRNWDYISSMFERKKYVPETWLDLCCGSGSLLRFVCKAGIKAYGLDNAPAQIEYAKKNAPDAELIIEDVRKFSYSKKFDVITSLFDSFNFITNKNELLQIFKNVKEHLNISGYFIFDINIFEGWEEGWNHDVVFNEEDKFLSIENTFDEKKELGYFNITLFIKDGNTYKRIDEVHIERCYHEEEIDTMLEKAGFVFDKIDGNKLKKQKKKTGRMMYFCKIK